MLKMCSMLVRWNLLSIQYTAAGKWFPFLKISRGGGGGGREEPTWLVRRELITSLIHNIQVFKGSANNCLLLTLPLFPWGAGGKDTGCSDHRNEIAKQRRSPWWKPFNSSPERAICVNRTKTVVFNTNCTVCWRGAEKKEKQLEAERSDYEFCLAYFDWNVLLSCEKK